MARRGAGRLADEDDAQASSIWRDVVAKARQGGDQAGRPAEPWTPDEVWVDEGQVREAATGAVARGERRPAPKRAPRRRAATGVLGPDELAPAVGPGQDPKAAQRLSEAARAFERERFPEARRLLAPLARRLPGAAAVRELHGLTLYRLGKWRDAARELEAFRTLTGSTEQHPVLADCYRALGRFTEVDELWEELRAASPRADLVAEGRIVAAGARADRGDLGEAIRLLERGPRPGKRLRHHHLRALYALADLYERAGDAPRARQLFGRVVDAAPDFADAADRARALR